MNIIKQISVFLENCPGTLAEALRVIKENNISLLALSMADTADFGILRIVVREPEKLEEILRSNGFAVRTTLVLAANVADNPGGLLAKVERLSQVGISIEYVYAFTTESGQAARVVLKVDDSEKAMQLLSGGGPDGEKDEDIQGFYW